MTPSMLPLWSCDCGWQPDTAAFVAALRGRYGDHSIFGGVCPGCAASFEAQLGEPTSFVGMTYAAGSLHFEPHFRVPTPGLSVETLADGDLTIVRGGGAERRLEVPPMTTWIALFPGHFAVGKTLDELALERCGVEVKALDRRWFVDVPMSRTLCLDAEHRISVHGTATQRRLAYERIRIGTLPGAAR